MSIVFTLEQRFSNSECSGGLALTHSQSLIQQVLDEMTLPNKFSDNTDVASSEKPQLKNKIFKTGVSKL